MTEKKSTRAKIGVARRDGGKSISRPLKPIQRNRSPSPQAAGDLPIPQLVGATLREQRRRLNLTLETVARRAGVTKGFLSEVERDNANPSVATLMRLREALSLSIASVFASSQARIVRADSRQEIFLGGKNIDYSLLSGQDAHRVTVVWARFDPGAQSGDDMHTLSADEEIIFVVSGSFEITLDGTTHVLGKGDAITFDPRRPHRYENSSRTTPAVAICVIAPPPRDRSLREV